MRLSNPGTPWLVQPTCTLALRTRLALVIVLAALAMVFSAVRLRYMENPFQIPDANQYLRLARGETSLVHQPFASRPLAPLIARGIASILHVSLEAGFFDLGLVSLAFALLVILTLAAHSAAPRWLFIGIAAVPFWPLLLHGYALPDIWYAAVLSGLLLCIVLDRRWATAVMFFPLMLSRESTLLTLVVLLIVGWRWLQLKRCFTAIAAMVAGSILVRHLSAGAPANLERLSPGVYLLGKVPWNLSRNMGVDPWSNIYPYLCGAPLWQHAVRLGPLHAVGVCQLSWVSPMQAFFALMTEFGLLPILSLKLWRWHKRVEPEDILTRFCLAYGSVSMLLAPMLGTAFGRLFGYAWPVFLVALPRLFPNQSNGSEAGASSRRRLMAAAAFSAIQVVMGVLGAMPAYGPDITYAVVLEALGILLLVTPLGTSLCASWSPGKLVHRDKMTLGNRPEQADFS